MMKLMLNGEIQEIPTNSDGQATVADLIVHLDMVGRPLAVELNKEVIRFRNHPTTRLKDGDTVEVVSLVGGG